MTRTSQNRRVRIVSAGTFLVQFLDHIDEAHTRYQEWTYCDLAGSIQHFSTFANNFGRPYLPI